MSPKRSAMAHHVGVSSVDDISYHVSTPGASSGTSEAIQTIVTGRKCWKTIKGKGEVVWPPRLEAALVQGLERYRPVDTRSARALGRFPMRNKFISDYIFELTGQRRTPKQVGSRLQQLRDTCEGKRILKLLTHRPDDPLPARHDASAASPDIRPSPSPPRDFVNLYVLPPHSPWTNVASTSASSLDNIPRPLRQINPAVTFRSAKALSAYSTCRVLRNGQEVFKERTSLDLTQTQAQLSTHYGSEHEYLFLYTTTLVPGYWQSLCDCADIGAYSIVQDIIRTPCPPSSSGLAASTSLSSSPIMPQDAAEDVLFSVVYQFLIGNPNSPPQSPLSSNGDGYSYSSASSPGDISPDLDDLSMLNTFNEAALSTPPPHSPSMQVGAYNNTYTHTQHPRGHEQRHRSSRPSPYDNIPPAPGLIRDGDEGYTDSLPTSPLDLTFGNVHAQSVGMSAADDMCGASFGHVAAAAAVTAPTYPTSFDVGGMSGVGYGSGVHSPGTSHFGMGY